MTEEELLAEEYICNGKCQDDITRNYVHCKTCTRLKDFLAGYKARKAELEKENTELKTKKIPQLERRIASIRGSHSVDAKKLNARIEQVERLKKENAELKEQCSILADCNTCVSDCKTENIEIKKQLTKAKELLKQWVELFKPKGGNIPPTPIQVDTEQFLNEVEK